MDRPLDIVDQLLLWGAGAIALFLVLLAAGWIYAQLGGFEPRNRTGKR